MSWPVNISIAAGLLLAACIAAFFHYFPNYSHRYRLTVEVEINGEIKTGTGVVAVSIQDQGPLTGLANGLRFNVATWGQAPVVDLGDKGLLVAVLYPTDFPDSYQPRPEPANGISFKAYFAYPHNDAQMIAQFRAIGQQKEARALDASDYPGFLWIMDRNDPGSARPVMPTDFANVIDPSLRIKSVTVEITHDANDNNIFKKLPWLEDLRKDEAAHGILSRVGVFETRARQFLGDKL